MNILFHTHEFNLKEGRPCTKRIDSLAIQLSKKGHNVTILAGTHEKIQEKIDRDYKIAYAYTTKNTKKNILARLLTELSFAITSFLKALTKTGKIDLVVTTSPPLLTSMIGFLIGKIKKAKIVFDVRDIWPDVAIEMESFTQESIYYKVFHFIAHFMYKHSDFITTVTPRKGG